MLYPYFHNRIPDDELFGEKRRVWLQHAASETKAEEAETAEQKALKLGEERINQYKGKTPDGALDEASQMLIANGEKVQDLLRKWTSVGGLRELGRGFGLGMLGLEGTNPNQIRKIIEEAAANRVKAAAEKEQLEQRDVTLHAQNSIALSTESVRTARELSKNLRESVAAKKQLLETAKLSLGFLERIGQHIPFRKTLNNEINRMGKIAEIAETIAAEHEKKIDKKSDKLQRIQTIENGIMQYVASHDSEAVPNVQRTLKECVISRYTAPFYSAIEEAGIKKGTVPYKAIESLLNKLLQGDVMGGYLGSLSILEIKQYFLSKVVEEGVGELNRKDEGIRERILRVEKCQLGQRIKVGEESYYLLKKEQNPKGYLLKEMGGTKLAYINIQNPDAPIYTREGGERGKFKGPQGLDCAAEGGQKNAVNFQTKVLRSSPVTGSEREKLQDVKIQEENRNGWIRGIWDRFRRKNS